MGDYHRARWTAVELAFKDRVVYAADFGASDNLYGWSNTVQSDRYTILSNYKAERFDLKRFATFRKLLTSKNIKYVCIPGYGRIEYIFFILYTCLTGRKCILFAESWYPSSRFIDKLKSIFLSLTCHGFLVSGQRALKHFSERLQIPKDRIRIGYSIVDNNHFHRRNQKPQNSKTLLCVARFSPEKNLRLVIDSFFQSNLATSNWKLMLVGGGPQLEELRNAIKNRSQVVLLQWQPYSKLPELYHDSTMFILASRFEPWGLVVNEAMAAGLPIILSDDVGCMPDLLIDGVNGWKVDGTNRSELVRLLNEVAQTSSEKLSQMGKVSLDIIQRLGPEAFAQGLYDLITK
jgi:glycosyltransferase involved in cell wall biosynthesis